MPVGATLLSPPVCADIEQEGCLFVIVLVTEQEFHRAPDVFQSSTCQCIAAAADETSLAGEGRRPGGGHGVVGAGQEKGAPFEPPSGGGGGAPVGGGPDGGAK